MEPIDEIKAEARRIEEDALSSAKGHFEAARPWKHLHLQIGIPIAVCAALAGVSAFDDHELTSGVLAMVVAVGSSLSTFLNPQDRFRRHCDAGNAYNALQNDARIFRNIDCAADADLVKARASLHDLARRRNELDQSSLSIPRKAFQAARPGIEAGEAQPAAERPVS